MNEKKVFAMSSESIEEGIELSREILHTIGEKYPEPDLREMTLLFFGLHLVVLELYNCISDDNCRETSYCLFAKLCAKSKRKLDEERGLTKAKPKD